jgi:hypothetical protein
MARALVIEEESGTSRGRVHAHNGYHAGDFSTPASMSVLPSIHAPADDRCPPATREVESELPAGSQDLSRL